MTTPHTWIKEPGARLESSRLLDAAKLQAPCIVKDPTGGYRLFYTAVGPEKPFPTCQGYILSAVSADGLNFHKEPGIRLAPQPALSHMSLRVIAPSINRYAKGRWRMYFESRGSASVAIVICSAISTDMLHWEFEQGIRLKISSGVRSPRYLPLPNGQGRLFCCGEVSNANSPKPVKGIISAHTADGLNFTLDPDIRLQSEQHQHDTGSFSAGEVIAPDTAGDQWTMYFSAWQDVAPGTVVPLHPSHDPNAEENGLSDNFAAASIASDLAGFRSRIFAAYSTDGMAWTQGPCAVEGAGYDSEDLDGVHAEDMSLIQLDDGRYRMYYAACNKDGHWRVLSAVTADS
jgi:hypothetical protein